MFRKMLPVLMALFVLIAYPAFAATFPDRPITIIVPFGAGGETDLVARMLADSMSENLKQNVVVQNIVGASGVAGMSAIIAAKPNGYTLGMSPRAPLAMHPHMRKVPYTLDSFDFVALVLKAPYIVMVPKSMPWNTLTDMTKDMKANPNKYFFASAGVGSVPYLALMDLLKKADVKARHVPFSGDPDAFQALAGNRAQVYASTAATLNQYDVKGLALMAEERDPLLPDLATIKEFDVAAYHSQWMALLAPKGVPADIMEKLNASVKQAMTSPKFIERLYKLGLVPTYLDTAATKRFASEDSTNNAIIIKELMTK